MSSETFEIIELANGDVALRRASHKEDPLVSIHFSAESLQLLRKHKVAVARAMLEAGIEAAQNLDDVEPGYFEDDDESVPVNHTIH